jgi:hypothetical protein
MQASCCDQGFSPLRLWWHVAVSPVRGFSMTTVLAQPASRQAAMIRPRHLNGDILSS